MSATILLTGGLPNCAAHGLRSAAATRLADYGATAHQLMSWFGWRTLSEAERYTRKPTKQQQHDVPLSHDLGGPLVC
jgi:hypothetical protein